MHYRQQLVELIETLEPLTLGVEVGVWRGNTSEQLLQSFPTLRLVGVDPYEDAQDYRSTGDPNAQVTQGRFDEMFIEVRNRLNPYGRFDLIRRRSVQTANCWDRGPCDFVFIDGNHSPLFVLTDCIAWWPHVRPGGLLIGHDLGNPGQWTDGVIRSWRTFADERGLKLQRGDGFVGWVKK